MRSEQTYVPLFFCSLLFLSCNLFETRDPVSPGTDNQTLPQATDDHTVIANFQTAVQQKNIQEYERLFADTVSYARRYNFIPNQSAAVRYSAVFSLWDKGSETDYFRNAVGSVGPSSSPQLSFSYPAAPIKYQSDSAVYTIDYTLFLKHNLPGVTDLFVGRCELSMSPNKNGIWSIYRWVDFETKKDSSWSELKGQFSK